MLIIISEFILKGPCSWTLAITVDEQQKEHQTLVTNIGRIALQTGHNAKNPLSLIIIHAIMPLITGYCITCHASNRNFISKLTRC